MTGLRQIKPIAMANVVAASVGAGRPRFQWVNPTTLHVEDQYQRSLGKRSVSLIRKIVAKWDWSHMKPPICVADDNGALCVVDGQHTAIAAASHPAIKEIPVMIVSAPSVRARAQAFIGHNRERLALTSMQIHYAAVASGDEIAVAVSEGCRRAKARVLCHPPAGATDYDDRYEVGDLLYPGALGRVAKAKGAAGLARVLKVLILAERAPITSFEIRAVAEVLFNSKDRKDIGVEALAAVVADKADDEWYMAMKTRAKENGISLQRALGELWLNELANRGLRRR
jgi:hypothetical protein